MFHHTPNNLCRSIQMFSTVLCFHCRRGLSNNFRVFCTVLCFNCRRVVCNNFWISALSFCCIVHDRFSIISSSVCCVAGAEASSWDSSFLRCSNVLKSGCQILLSPYLSVACFQCCLHCPVLEDGVGKAHYCSQETGHQAEKTTFLQLLHIQECHALHVKVFFLLQPCLQASDGTGHLFPPCKFSWKQSCHHCRQFQIRHHVS